MPPTDAPSPEPDPELLEALKASLDGRPKGTRTPTPSPEPWKVALAEALDFVVFPPDWTRKERAAGFLNLISKHHDPSCPGPTPTRTERVWLVMSSVDYEGDDVVSVHDSEEGATQECRRLQEAMDAAHIAERAAASSDADDIEWPLWPDGVPRCDNLYVSPGWEVRRKALEVKP